METHKLLDRALKFEFLNSNEGLFLFENAATSDLMFVANELRKKQVPSNKVTWIIDRNANTTNVCNANCKFCNFFRIPGHKDAFITTLEEYTEKIEQTVRYGGEQLLLQDGHHPDLGLDFYCNLFSDIKNKFPNIKLHALGPPEIAHISKIDNKSHKEVLKALIKAGLDSLPGAGAEILDDRVRRMISKGKCGAQEWLDIMREAHKLELTTSATMMFGHIETPLERFEHIVKIRQVQSEKPESSNGFIAFIAWPFQDDGTLLKQVKGISNNVYGDEYIRIVALSRIMLPNTKNIQASWLTVGKKVGQLCLHAGANDFGSIMIEENVVSASGAPHRFTSTTIQEAIKEAGFKSQLRNQEYEYRELPKIMEEQVVKC